ncbi:hypothetical protein [Anatilimnocola floriformis]|uniref:hypothetical protein n=1 Tax=Anatilimnocola floriformis TaxID=2948575 RepID=UPI0020C34F68|nr:hypothetical protein [Anatilimnocola floriformis]
MSDYLRTAIGQTREAIGRKERLLKSFPTPGVEVALDSLRRLLKKLEAELASLATPTITNPESVATSPESNCIPPHAS